MSNSRNIRSRTVSLRSLFPKAVIAAGDDILVNSCSRRIRPHTPITRGGQHVYVTGTDASSNADSLGDKNHADEASAAIANGATALLTDRLLPINVPQCIVDDVPAAHAKLCHELSGKPSTKMLTVAVVGSHGKTTAALYIGSMLKRLTGTIAYWTTLGATQHGDKKTNKNETNAQNLTAWLARAAKEDCPVAVIEISPAMLKSKVVSALEFDVVLCPGLREDQRYSKATSRFLELAMLATCNQLKPHGIIVYNADDARLNRWVARHELPAISYGLNADSEVQGRFMQTEDGDHQVMVSAGRTLMPMQVPATQYIARHMVAAVAVGYAFGLEINEVIGGVEQLKTIPGRMQSIGNNELVRVIVDRADQADRLAVTMHDVNFEGRRSIVVAEIPEASTPAQRAAYGRVLSRTASRVILTQSRASLTLGQALTWEVVDGCDHPAEVEIVPNRKAAIELAIRESNYGDQVVLVGMGSESWMPPREKIACSDIEVAKAALATVAKERVTHRSGPAAAVAIPNLRLYQE